MTIYFDPEYEADRQRGYDDAVAGRKSTTRNATSINAYSTGFEEGDEERKRKIHEKRVAQGKRLAKIYKRQDR